MTKAQLDRLTDLFERFVEAHEAMAEAAVMITTPDIISGEPVPAAAVADLEPAPEATDDSASDLFSLGGDAAASAETEDAPADTGFLDGDAAGGALDLSDKKAVEEFTGTLRALLGEFGKAKSPEDALALIEEVTGSQKFSECPPDKLEELHDAVYDALEE